MRKDKTLFFDLQDFTKKDLHNSYFHVRSGKERHQEIDFRGLTEAHEGIV